MMTRLETTTRLCELVAEIEEMLTIAARKPGSHQSVTEKMKAARRILVKPLELLGIKEKIKTLLGRT